MPMYEFVRDSSGEVIQLMLSFSEFDRRVKDGRIKLDDGEMASYSWEQHKLTSTVPSNYPMVCTAAGVHPDQVKEHMDHLRKMGCGQVNHTKDGDLIFESKGQRKRVLEALGLFDRNASYGDPTPKHRTANVRKYR